MTTTLPDATPGQLRTRERLVRLLAWLQRHPEVPAEYVEIGGDGTEIALGADGDDALAAAAAATEALDDGHVAVRLYPGCARLTVVGTLAGTADTICATVAVRESDGLALGALVATLPGLSWLGPEVISDAATLRAAMAATSPDNAQSDG